MSQTKPSLPAENAASSMPASSNPLTDSSFDPPDLDPSIILAAELGFVIAPVLTKSRYACARSYVGALTNDIDEIAKASARYPLTSYHEMSVHK